MQHQNIDFKYIKMVFGVKKELISIAGLKHFIEVCLKFIDHSIKANKREDNLYHAYNLMTIENDKEVSISYLSEMLEGQVAVLSSGYLSANEALNVLDGLKNSAFSEKINTVIFYIQIKNLPNL